MSTDESRGDPVVADVRRRAEELESLLESFGDRLRRMRQRNREVEHEIASFEEELDRLRDHLLDSGGGDV